MMAFFAAFDSPLMRFVPRVEDTFELYKNTLIGMVAVFQIPTLIFVLARLGIVSAGFLWRHVRYAILVAAVAAALLTPSPDPWNQLVFAAPMIIMYLLGIVIAWLCQRTPNETASGGAALRLVFAAGLVEGARRRDRYGWPQRPAAGSLAKVARWQEVRSSASGSSVWRCQIRSKSYRMASRRSGRASERSRCSPTRRIITAAAGTPCGASRRTRRRTC